MANYIGCHNCDPLYCDNCNIYILETMLREGKLDCLMDERHCITIAPESLRATGEWVEYDQFICNSDGKPIAKIGVVFVCSECGREEDYKEPYCHCGAKMKGESECSS